MILVQIDTPTPCVNGKPTVSPTTEERANYQAAQLRVTRDVESAPLLARPTGQNHPRVIFSRTSAEADVIRKWIQGAR